jgi:excisionase family DNA binding protein
MNRMDTVASATITDMKIGREEVLTLAQAAEVIGLSPNTLRNQIKNGALHGWLVGKTYVVRPKDLETYRKKHKGKPGAASPDHPRTGNRKPRTPAAPHPEEEERPSRRKRRN